MYSNAKDGLKKLYTAELLTIISGFSSSFVGEKLSYLGLGLALVGLVAFFISLSGLKQCAKDDKGYKMAYQVTILAILLSFVIGIVTSIKDTTVAPSRTAEITGVCNFLVAYAVMNTTAELLRKVGKDGEAEKAIKVRNLYTVAFLASEALDILSDMAQNDTALTVTFVLALVAIVVELVAQIKYIICLKQSSEAL